MYLPVVHWKHFNFVRKWINIQTINQSIFICMTLFLQKVVQSALQRLKTTTEKKKQQIKSRRKSKETNLSTPTDMHRDIHKYVYTHTHTHTDARRHTDTHTLIPTHTLAVIKETWLGSETWGMEESTFGGQPKRGISVQGRREHHHRDHPNPGRQEVPHQGAEPCTQPGRNQYPPANSIPSSGPETTPSLAGPHEETLEIKNRQKQ